MNVNQTSCEGVQEVQGVRIIMENRPVEEPMTIVQAEHEAEMSGDYKKQKFVSLFKSRTVISKIGTMPERRLALKMLKTMKRDGVKSV